MSINSLAPLASMTASNDGSGGGSSVIVIILIAVVALWIAAIVGRSASTVVVVEKPSGSYFGFGLIAVALGILYFVYIAPASGLI